MPLRRTLSSIYPDGKPRGTNNVAQSDADGLVILELADDSVRKSRTQTLDMLFAVSAADRATQFIYKKPKLHGVTELGDIRLSLGGTFAGICLDSHGNPIPGAILYAIGGVTPGNPEVLSALGPRLEGAQLRTTSREDGSFELSGIPAKVGVDGVSTAYLWAHAPGYLWTQQGPIKVEAGKRSELGNITLILAPPALRVEGIVYQPDGQPAAGARIDYFTTSMPPHGQVFADKLGHFIVIAKDDVPMEFVARDAKNEFGMSPTRMAKRGESIDLHLATRRLMSVFVTDYEGDPIHDVNVMAVLNTSATASATASNQDTRLLPGERWANTDKNGKVELVIPNQRFSVTLRNTDYNSKTRGPYTQATAPELLNVTMPRGAEQSGRVLAYGKPVEGATVTVMRRHRRFASMTGGFPNRYPSGTQNYRTDSEGKFTAPLKKNWITVGVVAKAEGFATGETQVEISPDEDLRDIDVHLTRGGTIEGLVTPPEGIEVQRLYVAASRGDGNPISTFVDAKGRFRLIGLTPGNWRVEGRTQQIRKEMLSISRHPLDLNPRWNALVVDAKTLKLNIDMSELGDVQLSGQLIIDGEAPLPGWSVQVVRPPHERGPTSEKAQMIDRHGLFTFMTEPGRAQLRLLGPLKGGARAELLREIDLHGPHFKWRESLLTAIVSKSLDDPTLQARFVRGADDQIDRDLTTVPVDDEGKLSARVPVGHSRLQTRPKSSRSKNDWQTVRTVEIR